MKLHFLQALRAIAAWFVVADHALLDGTQGELRNPCRLGDWRYWRLRFLRDIRLHHGTHLLGPFWPARCCTGTTCGTRYVAGTLGQRSRGSGVVRARRRTVIHDFSAIELRQAIDASRRRIGLDQLDGLLLHST